MTPIKFIGKRPTITDATYGTGLMWTQGETKPVPDTLVSSFLRHADAYVLGELPKEPVPDPVSTETEDVEQEIRYQIASWDKPALADYAKVNFNINLDKRLGVESLRAHVTQLVDQFGVA